MASVLSIVLVSALVASVFFATMEETRVGTASSRRETAFGNAELGIVGGVGVLRSAGFEQPVAGQSIEAGDGAGGRAVVYITRLDSTLFAIVSSATSTPGITAASTRIGVVVSRSVGTDGSITVSRIPEHAWSQLF